MYKVVLLRHGESIWNKENLFTGWTDVDLSETGVEEAHTAAKLLKEEGYSFDLAFTSVLKRAIRTLWIVMDDMDLMWIPVIRHWRLNERMYGALQGVISGEIKAGKKVIVAAHGNSLRALVKYLDDVPDDVIPGLNIPTGVPLIYELDAYLKPIKHYYLGDHEAVQAAIKAVANQAKKK